MFVTKLRSENVYLLYLTSINMNLFTLDADVSTGIDSGLRLTTQVGAIAYLL